MVIKSSSAVPILFYILSSIACGSCFTPKVLNLGVTISSSPQKLYAVAIPAEQEDEKKKRSSSHESKEIGEDLDQHDADWTFTRGGFIPNILKRKISKKAKQQKSRRQNEIQLIDNIHDYKEIVVEERNKIVVVRFVADWCRSCKAMKIVFNKVVKKSGAKVKFIEVPLTKETEYLLNGLGVKSVPFAHIYHPDVGLVEEMKISKPHFAKFVKKLNSYIVGSCNLSEGEIDNDSIGSFQ